MKRIIIFLFISCLMTTSLFGAEDAFEQGSKRLGGFISFYSTMGSAYRSTTVLTISPSLSFAVHDKLFIGVNASFEEYDYGNNYSSSNWSVGPLLEYYFAPSEYNDLDGRLVPYLRLSYTKGENNDLDFSYKIINVGIMKMLSSHVGLDFGVVYSFDSIERYTYSFDPQYGSYSRWSEGDGHRLMIGIGIESFIF